MPILVIASLHWVSDETQETRCAAESSIEMPKLNGGQEAILKTVRGLSCTRGCGTYHSQKNDSTSNEKKRVITKQGDVIFEPWPRKSRNLFPSLAFLSSFVTNHESPLFSILPIYLGTSARLQITSTQTQHP